jgi:hypothetical protein
MRESLAGSLSANRNGKHATLKTAESDELAGRNLVGKIKTLAHTTIADIDEDDAARRLTDTFTSASCMQDF